eukprot:CAMPEP_0172508994 /NCGR_PEP_ID=MMETSP1066-20121228/216681_1 /TAXON_ID=671091 /ORGANISM="Coscinodiscus wailesii, Strain CCMP2513" /LENGTH=429 /DNA_ID=CAMNT_0013287265 /DNA_START=318 /DNA_END=1607 /DNA_ORIENTATION=-
MKDIVDSILVEGSPEKRLQSIMTKAKEEGIPTDKIFNFFQREDSQTNYISKTEFVEALEKLGDNVFVLSDDELDDLVTKFDTNGDGTISLAEFKHYCYHNISTVPWKAERQRLERTGEMEVLKENLFGHLDRGAVEEEVAMVSCGEEVHVTTKLFWKDNINLDIRLFYCDALDVITIQLFDESSGKDLPSVYVRKENCPVNKDELNEIITNAVQTSDTRAKEDELAVRKKAEWDFYANYLLARLKVKHQIPTSKPHDAAFITDEADEPEEDVLKKQKEQGDVPKKEEEQSDVPKKQDEQADVPTTKDEEGDAPKTQEKITDIPKTQEEESVIPKTQEEDDHNGSDHHHHQSATIIPFLGKLTGDEYDTLMIKKPNNLEDPRPMKRPSMDAFNKAVDSFVQSARRTSVSRQSAQDLQKICELALTEIKEE